MRRKIPISFFKGFIIGAGAILPGISGASLAVMFGVYEDIVALLANPFHHFRAFFRKHTILMLGSICGFLAVSQALVMLIASHTVPVLFLFTGFIAGTLPGIYRRGKSGSGGPAKYIAFFAMTGLMVCLAVIRHGTALDSIQSSVITKTAMAWLDDGTTWSPAWIAAGAIIGLGSLLPGVSASFLLMYIGWYAPLLAAVGGISVIPLLQVGFGAALSLMCLSKLTVLLYTKFHEIVSFGVLGLTLGSLTLVFGNIPPLDILPVCLLLLGAGFTLSCFLDIQQNR